MIDAVERVVLGPGATLELDVGWLSQNGIPYVCPYLRREPARAYFPIRNEVMGGFRLLWKQSASSLTSIHGREAEMDDLEFPLRYGVMAGSISSYLESPQSAGLPSLSPAHRWWSDHGTKVHRLPYSQINRFCC
jgi:hypothetical protein